MAQQYFVLGIGGTGMRCIESLIHLCAMGMFDDTDIHLLALDTDKDNGNFARLKEVKEAYAFTTALGLYQFYLNGRKVGEDEMTPGWTSYRRHLLYQTYDVCI